MIADRRLELIVAVTIVFYVIARFLTHSRVGTVLKSIRDNDVRAEFMGYNVANYRIFVFCISALPRSMVLMALPTTPSS